MEDDAQAHAPAGESEISLGGVFRWGRNVLNDCMTTHVLAHRALFNQELLSTILELLRRLEDEGEIPKLHPLLFVNKSFFQTTADLLWKDMESFQPFIQSFLPLVGQMPSPEVSFPRIYAGDHALVDNERHADTGLGLGLAG